MFSKILKLTLLILACLVFWPSSARAATLSRPSNYLTLNSGLVGWWTFDGQDMYNYVVDSSSQANHGRIVGQPATSTVAGKLGQALEFDGINDAVLSDDYFVDFNNGDTITLAMWIKPVRLRGWDSFFFKDGNFGLQLDETGTGRVTFSYQYTGGYWEHYTTTDPVLPKGQWTYVVFTYKFGLDNTGIIYVNGAPVAGAWYNPGNDALTPETNFYVIGNSTPNGCSVDECFKGALDDIRVYNRILSSEEVKRLYNSGSAKFSLTPRNSLSNGLVGHWTFDGPDMANNVADKSGNNYNGYMQGFTSTSSAQTGGKIGQALKFDGINDYVDITTLANFQAAGIYTYSAWAKVSGSFRNTIIAQYRGGIGGGGFAFMLNESGKLSFRSGGFAIYERVSVESVSPDTWTFVTAVYNGPAGDIKLYKNGVFLTSNLESAGSFADYGSGGVEAIGTYWLDVYHLKGSIDDVRVYNRALSVNEIKQLYNQGAANKISASPPSVFTVNSSGPKAPGTMATSNSSGGTEDWGNPDNAKVEDALDNDSNKGGTRAYVKVGDDMIDYCLSPDTRIATPEGIKEIKDIKIGDLVLSYNEITKAIETNLVSAVNNNPISRYGNKYYRIFFDGGEVRATFNHKFYTTKGLKLARDLTFGDWLIRTDGQTAAIRRVVVEENFSDTVWDISVNGNHNYFAEGVLVHNGGVYDYRVRIIKGGVIGTTDKASANAWAGSLAYVTYGSATDKWGETWTANDINSSSFGVAISAYGTGFNTADYTSYYLNATNFGFAIPAGAIISGIQADVKRGYFIVPDNYYSGIDYLTITVFYSNSSLVGHWTFDGPDMTQNVKDTSGQGNNAFMSGFTSTSSAQVVGKIGQALKFDGVNDIVSASGTSLTSTPFSHALWFKPSNLLGFYRLSNHGANRAFTVKTDKKLYFGTEDSEAFATTSTLKPNVWYQAVFTYDGTTGILYLNGNQESSLPSSVGAAASPLVIGRCAHSDHYFPGQIDDFRIYNRALSPSEVKQLYEMGR